MIQFDGVVKEYPGGRGLHRLDLAIAPGVNGIVGRNGAGKTTALKLIVGQIRPNAGRVAIDGQVVGSEGGAPLYRRRVGYAPSEDYFFPFLSGRRNLEYLGYLRCGDRGAYKLCAEVAEELEIDDFLDEPFSSYSSGIKKKVQLLGSLVGDPEILIWDEPNNGVDLMANLCLRDLLQGWGKAGKTILLSSHVLEFMSGLLDSIAILENGLLVAREAPVPEDLRGLFLSSIGREEER
jgi:ABC-2 type transport system ATP-binding protein